MTTMSMQPGAVQDRATGSRAERAGFRAWRRRRPLVGGILVMLSGIEMFFSGQLDLGNIKIQLGFEGFQATVIPALLALLGLLVIVTPAQRMFYGIFALILAVYSLVGVNLGGFLVGMLLGAVGGVLTVAWRPRTAPVPAESEATESPAEAAVASAADEPERPRRPHGAEVVHAEAVDYATLRARADVRKGAAEPRPFRSGRS